MAKIYYTNLKLLNVLEQKILKEIVEKEVPGIEQLIKNEVSFKVNIKEYSKEGKRKKYSIHFEAISTGKKFATEAFDWDLKKAIHKAFYNLANEIKSSLKTERKGWVKRIKKLFYNQ